MGRSTLLFKGVILLRQPFMWAPCTGPLDLQPTSPALCYHPPEEEQRAPFLWYTAAADTEDFAKQALNLAGLTNDTILIALMNSGTGPLTGSKELATLKATVAFSQAFSTQKLVSLIERVTQKLADEAQTRSQQPEHPILHRIYPIQLSAHLQLLKLLTTVHKNVSEEIALQGVSSTTSPS